MYRLKYKIKTEAPIVISAKYGDMNMVTTEKFIPGTSVLGIIAQKFISKRNITFQNAHHNQDFYNWFLNGDLKFGNAYVSHKINNKDEIPHFPTPNSIHIEKNGKQVYDLLFIEKGFAIQTKPLAKFCNLKDETIYIKTVDTSLNFHHARNRKKGISEEGLIFNYESIDSDQTFVGSISGEKADLENLLKICAKKWTSYIGRSKNAQYGRANFEFIDDEPKLFETKIEFEQEMSLSFLSNTIIYDENGFSTTDVKALEKYLAVKIEKAFIKKGEVENFVGVWRLKKPSEVCFLAGSTFLLHITENDLEKMLKFQHNGIGERTHEGFGQCRFGWQESEVEKLELTEYYDSNSKNHKPDISIPAKTRAILRTIILNSLKKQAENLALKDLNEFIVSRYPTNTLIGRLQAIIKEQDKDGFIKTINKFRKSAKDKLEYCKSEQENLFQFLNSKNITYEVVLKKIPNRGGIEELCQEIEFNPQNEPRLETELYRTYFNTFFSMMRKRVKTVDVY